MWSILTSRLRRFAGDTRGYITLEAIIVMPALLWLFGVSWVYFDVFRQQAVNQKANYTIGDMVSRETEPLNDSYITNARELLYLLTRSEGAATDLRLSVVRYTEDDESYQVVWSETRGSKPALIDADMSDYQSRLPILANNDQVILVETWDDYSPVFHVGLSDFEIRTYSFTRPRFAPQILFAG